MLLVHAFGCNIAVAIATIRKIWGSMPGPSIPGHVVQRIRTIKDKRLGEVKIPLLDILEDFQGLSATDPRDIIYAALNIASDIKEGDIRADYTISVADVYRAVAVHHLKDAVEPLRILSHCEAEIENIRVSWPSWVPSWQGKQSRFILRKCVTTDDGSQRPAYDPCGIAHFSAELYPIRIEDNVLRIHGFLIDQLSSLLFPCLSNIIRDGVQRVNEWTPEDRTALYRTGETMLDAFLKTIVANMSDSIDKPQRGGKAPWDIERGCIPCGNFIGAGEHVFEYTEFRCLAYSTNGYMALVSYQAEEGDLLYALFGGSVLYVLRPAGDRFMLIGECYVHGLMDGEAMQLLETGQTVIEVVSII